MKSLTLFQVLELHQNLIAMEIFLVLNGFEIKASVEEQEDLFLNLASGKIKRHELVEWLEKKIAPLSQSRD